MSIMASDAIRIEAMRAAEENAAEKSPSCRSNLSVVRNIIYVCLNPFVRKKNEYKYSLTLRFFKQRTK